MTQVKLNLLKELVIASHNMGKVREFEQLLAPYGTQVISAGKLGLEEPEETGKTFHDNAALKAFAAAEACQKAALADDSGIEVEGLSGAPGIYSARWAGPNKDFKVAMQRVWDELQEVKDDIHWPPKANFICVLCLAWPDKTHKFYEGKVFGELVWPARGDKGFGYDPMFVPNGYDITFGEMSEDTKQKISHRAHAFDAFIKDCF